MSRTLSFRLLIACSCLLLGASAVAAATPAPRPVKGIEEAKRLFRLAETEYKLGRFEQALALFSKAYEAKPVPAFLFNIGQCHFNLRNFERALFFYEGYLRDQPNVPNAEAVTALIAEARAEIKKKPAEQTRKDPQTSGPASPATSPVEIAIAPASGPSSQSSTPAKSAEPEDPVYKKWWLWTIVGVVVAGGVVTAAVLITRPQTPVIDWSK